MTSIYKKFEINGPVQIVRLEGNINEIRKVIYIFGDYHFNVNIQSECDSDASLDVDQFLKQAFNGIDKKIDLFVEMNYNDARYHQTNKYMYIEQVRKFALKNFPQNINNVVKSSQNYPNVRFHFFDFRDDINNFIYALFRLTDYLCYPSIGILHDTINTINTLINNVEQVISILKSIKHINKISNNYNNDNVKKIIVEHYHEYIASIKKLPSILNKIKKQVEKIIINVPNCVNKPQMFIFKTVYVPLIKIYDEHSNYFNFIVIALTDMYLLRRFLDKNYITNAIVYAGNAHLAHLTFRLIKEFGFKLTHINKTEHPVDFINDEINKLSTYDLLKTSELLSGFENLPSSYIYQCSNLFDFPENFD